ncbi:MULTISPECIES: hypothetical protein [unclassified Microcoleus]|uniref:hypothetical protein n=1 Tax=unclassified Microcoleus TaxID=2642155 RepID=UPI0025FE4630|nr:MULTISPECIES: hypothetical protein [unclassified Microcoleus]
MDATFAQAVVEIFSINFQILKQIDERTGGSGENETRMNEALAALQNISAQMSSVILDAPAPESSTEPAQ